MKKYILATLVLLLVVLVACSSQDVIDDDGTSEIVTEIPQNYSDIQHEDEEHIDNKNSPIVSDDLINLNKANDDMNNDIFYPFIGERWIMSDLPQNYNYIRNIRNKDIFYIQDMIQRSENTILGVSIGVESYSLFETEFGVLLGFNGGGNGGSLSYIQHPPWHELSAHLINNHPIVDIFEHSGQIYYIWNASFGQDGGLGKIEKINNIWTETLSIEFGEAIYSYLLDGENLYLVTRSRLILVKDTEINNVLIHCDLSMFVSMYPISMLKMENIIYIGGRGGIISYNTSNSETLWWTISEE